MKSLRRILGVMVLANALVVGIEAQVFGPANPFFAKSTLPYQAPAFDRIKDGDFQPAIEAGMAEQRREIRAIAENPDAPTFENTIVAMEKTGRLFSRVMSVFSGLTGANTNPTLQKVQDALAPKLAAHQDAIYLDAKLFARVAAVYNERESLKLTPEGHPDKALLHSNKAACFMMFKK